MNDRRAMPHLPEPGAHGGDGYEVARALQLDPATILDLSMSLNPFAPSLIPIATRHLDTLGRYPSATETARAEAAIAEAIGVSRHRIVITNGGAEAIQLVAAEVGGSVWSEPEFSLHPRRRRKKSSGPAVFDIEPRWWRSNPHNPSGELAPDDPDPGILVWDEAFYPLATGTWTRSYPNPDAIVVGSLTKLFSCPGLRLGYVLAPDAELARDLRARQQPWSVNALGLAVVPSLMKVASIDLRSWSVRIANLRHELRRVLRTMGFSPLESDANWVLVPDAGDLRQLLALEGIVVRDCASFGLPGTVRIAVPEESGLSRLDRALKKHIGGGS